MNRWLKNIFVSILLVIVFNPFASVYAQQTTQSIDNLPQYNSGVEQSIIDYLCTPSENADGLDLVRCVNKLYRGGIAFGAIALVFFLVYAGYRYMMGGEQGKESAKKTLQNAFFGMGLLLGSYVLLYFINPSLVTFKPIQAPIFVAPDQYPSCEEIGFGVECVMVEPNGNVIRTTGGGSYADCPDGLVAFDKKAIPVNKGNDTEQICNALMVKLKQIHATAPIIATATIGPGHQSNCHKAGNSKSGVCADIVPSNGNYTQLCNAINSVGGLVIVNESGGSEAACGKAVVFGTTTGNHLHIYLRG